jgi:hypothetical protein
MPRRLHQGVGSSFLFAKRMLGCKIVSGKWNTNGGSRKTLCFSTSPELHDIVIGLFVNRYEFG